MAMISFEIKGNSALHSYRRNSVSSHVVPISWRPFFSVVLNLRKTRKIQLFHVQKLNYGAVSASLESGLVTDGRLPKESGFKPSFDEYLTAMESLRAVREMKQPSTNAKLKLKEKGIWGKPSLDRDEGNNSLETSGGPLDKMNEFEFASENQALDVDETVKSKKCSSSFKSDNELRGKGIKRLKNESKLDVMVKQKDKAVIAEDKRLKSQIRDSELESDDRGGIVDSSTTEGKLMADLHSFNALREKDLTNGQRDSNSLGKTEGEVKLWLEAKVLCSENLREAILKLRMP